MRPLSLPEPAHGARRGSPTGDRGPVPCPSHVRHRGHRHRAPVDRPLGDRRHRLLRGHVRRRHRAHREVDRGGQVRGRRAHGPLRVHLRRRLPRAVRSPADRPRCWQASWDVAGDASLLIVQHLLLGINAHVNHDLALSVVEVADQTGDLAAIRPDFDAVNAVLASTQRDVLGRLDRVSRWTNVAAGVGGGRAFNFSLDVARRQAWQASERLYPLDPAGRQRYRQQLDSWCRCWPTSSPARAGSCARPCGSRAGPSSTTRPWWSTRCSTTSDPARSPRRALLLLTTMDAGDRGRTDGIHRRSHCRLGARSSPR